MTRLPLIDPGCQLDPPEISPFLKAWNGKRLRSLA
jgi:hypothetical protein